ncbi:MAG: AI-2E family transporter [Muribaculaceae bacterium]|nr:AI-2E family transporter [Muribaculaceae bacterium]
MACREFTFDRVARICFSVVVALALLWLVYYLRSALLPFGLACLICYMAEPLVQWNMRVLHLKHRALPVLITLLEIAVVTGGVAAIFLPSVIDDCHKAAVLFQKYADTGLDSTFLPVWLQRFIHSSFDLNDISRMLHDSDIQQSVQQAMHFLSGGLDAMGSMLSAVMVLLYIVFILINYPGIAAGIRNLVPPRYRDFSNPLIDNISGTMKRYFRTQALISVMVGVGYGVGFGIVGLPMAAAWGVLNGVLYMVPYAVYLSVVPVTLLCIVVSLEAGPHTFWALWGSCMAVFAVVQLTADYVVTPHLMSKSMNLDPAVILLSLSIWGTLFGLLGVIFALPLTTIFYTYYRRYFLDTNTKVEPNE